MTKIRKICRGCAAQFDLDRCLDMEKCGLKDLSVEELEKAFKEAMKALIKKAGDDFLD